MKCGPAAACAGPIQNHHGQETCAASDAPPPPPLPPPVSHAPLTSSRDTAGAAASATAAAASIAPLAARYTVPACVVGWEWVFEKAAQQRKSIERKHACSQWQAASQPRVQAQHSHPAAPRHLAPPPPSNLIL